MKEIVIISGKGGTGKTSIAASFAVLAEDSVVADCDVDAADLHLLLRPKVKELHEFRSGREAFIRGDECSGCGACFQHCRFGAVIQDAESGYLVQSRQHADCDECDSCKRSCVVRTNVAIREMSEAIGCPALPLYRVDPNLCEGCGVCVQFCPEQAIDFQERVCGEWMISESRTGPMVHARMHPASENSGKLVSLVRREARRIAGEENRQLIITDGPPGIGCPVIASITGADQVLVITEPTLSGEHDLKRVLSLTRHFKIETAVCVNKWDLNPGMTSRIENAARSAGATVTGRVRYDPGVTKAQMQELTVVEHDVPSGEDIKDIWKQLGLQGKEEKRWNAVISNDFPA